MGRAETSRRAKTRKRAIISSLPDCLIHVIMSFMTAQEAVRTCVLSKRWKNLWTTLPFLDFDLSEFEHDDESDGESQYYEIKTNKFQKFREFVKMTLLLRGASNLHSFCLSCPEMFDLDKYLMFIRSWILYVLKHNVQVLNIDFGFDGSLPLGNSIFTCVSLVDATLNFPISHYSIRVINLPCLKRLYLRWIYLAQEFIDELFCGCPVLEFLHLEDCCRGYSTINCKSLKYLIVEDCNSTSAKREEVELINTPNLLSFCYGDDVECFGHDMLLKMLSLTSASICVRWTLKNVSYKGKNNVLLGLSGVQNPKLVGAMIKGLLKNELPNCPEFSNMKDLLVDGLCLSCHFDLLGS
ncbi:hypothetical protein LUZ63_015786 [Rhynchospora breviuscula]|uniref:F-box domain-containing protein n=1 Tax=Rhynchospora breviuscula TaxID=2022672 RepID=A0A9Q0HME9_9POAL|nr:hypothetical protein LUZ63_015786 [Rhynchospora breviuscula]